MKFDGADIAWCQIGKLTISTKKVVGAVKLTATAAGVLNVYKIVIDSVGTRSLGGLVTCYIFFLNLEGKKIRALKR